MRRNAARVGILMAFEGLNAAQSQHETAPGIIRTGIAKGNGDGRQFFSKDQECGGM
jgi:hypothetical protein